MKGENEAITKRLVFDRECKFAAPIFLCCRTWALYETHDAFFAPDEFYLLSVLAVVSAATFALVHIVRALASLMSSKHQSGIDRITGTFIIQARQQRHFQIS
jgi:TctA family transporter